MIQVTSIIEVLETTTIKRKKLPGRSLINDNLDYTDRGCKDWHGCLSCPFEMCLHETFSNNVKMATYEEAVDRKYGAGTIEKNRKELCKGCVNAYNFTYKCKAWHTPITIYGKKCKLFKEKDKENGNGNGSRDNSNGKATAEEKRTSGYTDNNE